MKIILAILIGTSTGCQTTATFMKGVADGMNQNKQNQPKVVSCTTQTYGDTAYSTCQ